jgi:hypothetical protein
MGGWEDIKFETFSLSCQNFNLNISKGWNVVYQTQKCSFDNNDNCYNSSYSTSRPQGIEYKWSAEDLYR